VAKAGHRVTGVDYSHEALRIARAADVDDLADFRFVNINDRAALFELGAWMLGTGDEWCVFAHHTTQTLTTTNRQNLLLFLDLVLRGRGFADLISDENFSVAYERGKPSTWHLPFEWLERETEGHPLALERIDRWKRREGIQRRRVATTRVRRTNGRIEAGDEVFRRELRERATMMRDNQIEE
jgi:hypothetical protein